MGGNRIAICMAAYNPRASLFRRQIESIRQQTFTDWKCIITVDADERGVIAKVIGRDRRFKIVRNRTRLGFYRNFEKAISRAPEADFIALADQDDKWGADKLEALHSAFTDRTQLVYSDCRLVSENGETLSPTFWHNRRNNFTNLPGLIVANTVSGAACMFRASLLPQILPFPTPVGDAFHDAWIALIAIANGDLGYVDTPLYDYIQHGANVIGHRYAMAKGPVYFAKEVWKHRRNWRAATEIVLRSGESDFPCLTRRAHFCRMVLERTGCTDRRKRKVFQRLARYDEGLAVPIFEKIRASLQNRPSLRMESMLLHAALSVHLRRMGIDYSEFLPQVSEPQVPELKSPVNTLSPAQLPQNLFLEHPLDF